MINGQRLKHGMEHLEQLGHPEYLEHLVNQFLHFFAQFDNYYINADLRHLNL
jgi:hypothetical protein